MNHQRTFHQRLLRSQRGSVLLMSVIMGVVISIMFFASIAYIETQVKVMTRSSTKADRRIVMDGLYSYTINGIKQSWCMSSTWVQDAACDLNNARNTQRLLLSDEALLFINNSGTPHPTPLTSTRLSSISQTVNLDSITSSHPLFSIMDPLRKEYESVTFTIQRDSSAISAVRGREVPLKITVFLKHKTNAEFNETLVSRNIVYPRELSYFGLILSNNLHLASNNNNASTGNIGLQNIVIKNANAGLRFESPVFINGDLNLPASTLRPAMNNVIFADKIVFGGGGLKMDGADYMVKAAGGDTYAYNYSMPNFSGIMGGFERDPARDDGLDYLFSLVGGGQVSYSDRDRCRDRLMASYDLKITNAAQLWVLAASSPSASNTATLKYNLGRIDNFVEQSGVDGYSSVTTVPNISGNAAVTTQGSTSGGPIIRARVYYNGLLAPSTTTRQAYSTEFYIHRSGQVVLYPNGAGTPAITINSAPLVVDQRQQFNEVSLTISIDPNVNIAPYAIATNPSAASNVTMNAAPSIKFVFEAYDYAYSNGNNLRETTAPFYRKLNGATFSKSGNAWVLSATGSDSFTSNKWQNNSGLEATATYAYSSTDAAAAEPGNNENLAAFDDICFATPDPADPNVDYSAFPAATWDTSFAKQARNSWSFDTEYANRNTPGYKEDGTAYNIANDKEFHIDSLVSTCTVGPTQTLLAGMFTCEKFVIQKRAQPLRIIGTVITNQLDIDASAYTYGIRWSSIYHPQAVQELINAGILGQDKAGKAVDCSPAALAPLWQSNIGINSRYEHYVCNPVSLRTADPFKWSSVDPDCGLQLITGTVSINNVSVKCKKKTTRFLVKEISRGKGL